VTSFEIHLGQMVLNSYFLPKTTAISLSTLLLTLPCAKPDRDSNLSSRIWLFNCYSYSFRRLLGYFLRLMAYSISQVSCPRPISFVLRHVMLRHLGSIWNYESDSLWWNTFCIVENNLVSCVARWLRCVSCFCWDELISSLILSSPNASLLFQVHSGVR
jgi:hypothetical protein